MMKHSSTEIQGKEQVNKSIKMGKLFPALFFILLIFSTTVKSWEVKEDNFNSAFELCWNKAQHGLHNNLIQYNYRKFIKYCQVNNRLRISLKVKLLLKCVAYIMYKTVIKHMGIKLGKSITKVPYISYS